MNGYRCLMADPPWAYDDALAMGETARAAGAHYATLPPAAIAAFLDQPAAIVRGDDVVDAVPGSLVAADAHLWLWVTNPFLLDGTGARIAEAWGFAPKALTTWVKGRIVQEATADLFGPVLRERLVLNVGMGHYTRGVTEHLIFCTRGRGKALVQDRGVPNLVLTEAVLLAPRGAHSAKPDEAYAHVERISPGPRLDLFARRRRPGWDAIGDEL